DGATAAGAQHLGGEHLGRSLVGLHHLDGPRDRGRLEPLTGLQEEHHLLEQATDLLRVVAADGDLVASDVDLRVGVRAFDQAQQLVALAEEGAHQVVAGNADLYLGRRHASIRCSWASSLEGAWSGLHRWSASYTPAPMDPGEDDPAFDPADAPATPSRSSEDADRWLAEQLVDEAV